jgi:glutathione peroxidase
MMKITFLFIAVLLMTATFTERTDNIYKYELNSIDGKNISLGEFEGNVLLIVNTASKCGYTHQYSGLQLLHDQYKNRGFSVLGFPTDNFGGQEFDSDEEIAEFCQLNFGVNFPLFSKIDVKGESIHPLFKTLTEASNPDFSGEIGWNFEKFLVDRNGNLIRRFKSNVTPDSAELVHAVETALK